MVNTNSVLSSILFSQTIDWNIKQFFSSTSINSSFELKRIGKAITRRKDQMVVEDDKRYKRITIKTNCGGVFVRDEVLGKDIKTKKQYYVKAGQLAVSKIDARNGAFGIVPPEADGAIITGNFWVYDVNPGIANIDYLILLLSSNVFVQAWQDCSNGSGNRLYLQEDRFLNYKIPMPAVIKQKQIVDRYNKGICDANSATNKAYELSNSIDLCLFNLLHKPSSPVNISAVIECKLSLCKDNQPYHDCCKPSNPEYFGTVEFLALRPKQIFHHFLHLTFSEPMPHSPIQPKQQPIHQYTEMRLEYLMADRIQHPEYHT